MQKVALMGLGIMGTGIARNLMKAGFPLTVYNRTRSKADPLASDGATVVDTPRQASDGADVIISMVGDDAASRTVWTGENGALSAAKSGAVLIECSTLSPEWVRELNDLAAQQGCRFIDSPVAGSKEAAATATLKLLVGGDAATIDSVRPILSAISNDVAHLGPVGSGATWKLINNMMAAVQLAAVAEGIALAERAGLDMAQVGSLIMAGGSSSPTVKGKLDRMLQHRYENTEFALRWMQKDVTYALELGKDLDQPLRTAEAALHIYQQAAEKGLSDQDFSAVVEGARQE